LILDLLILDLLIFRPFDLCLLILCLLILCLLQCTHVIKFSRSSDKAGKGMLNELQFVGVLICYAIHEGITVVEFSIDNAAGNCT